MNGRGIVTSIRGGKAMVRVSSNTEGGCASCAARSGCHAGGYSGREITVLNDFGAKVDNLVAFEADPGKVLLSAALIWILPIIAMFIGYLAGTRLGGGFIPIAAALIFLAASYFVLRFVDRAVSGGRSFYPRIVSIIDETSAGCEPEKTK